MVKYRLITTIGLVILLVATFINFSLNLYRFFALKTTPVVDTPREVTSHYGIKETAFGNRHKFDYYVPVQEGYVFKAIQPLPNGLQAPPQYMATPNTANLVIPSVYPGDNLLQNNPPQENKEIEKPQNVLPDLTLAGILANDGGESVALVEENGGTITYIVKKGDYIKNEKLIEVGADYIMLEVNKNKRRLELKKLQ